MAEVSENQLESTPAPAPELVEVPPVGPVKRSRLAFAVAVTVAALPILVVDNLPGAPASASSERVVVTGPASEGSLNPVSTTVTVAVDTASSVPAAEEPSAKSAETTSEEVSTAAASPAEVAKVSEQASAPKKASTPKKTSAPARPAAAPASPAPAPAPTTTTAPAVASAPAPEPAPAASKGADPNDPQTWDRLAQCEAGGNWAINTGNGYYGGLQFSLGTWQAYGGTGRPDQASKATQIAIGKRLQADRGWGAWPGCSRHLGFYG